MKKHTILITGLLTIVTMALVGVGCSKKDAPSSESITYESQKARIAELEKKIGKTRAVLPATSSWTSGSNIPVPVITQMNYCGSGPSPLGSGYTRWRYRINVDNATKTYMCNNSSTRNLEFKFYMNGMYGNDGWKFTNGGGMRACADWPRCIYLDTKNITVLGIPDLLTASFVPFNQTSNYQINGYSGYIVGSALPPTLSISKTFLMDGQIYPNPCP
jgi:hypothetical protein